MTASNDSSLFAPLAPLHKLDIMAIGVHPDDVDLSCAGTLLKHLSLGKKCGIL